MTDLAGRNQRGKILMSGINTLDNNKGYLDSRNSKLIRKGFKIIYN